MKKLVPNLMVEDVNKTLKFYKEILGFETVMTVPQEGEFNWAMMKNGHVEIMFQKKESLCQEIPDFKDKKICGTFTLYIDVPDINKLYMDIKNKVTVVKCYI